VARFAFLRRPPFLHRPNAANRRRVYGVSVTTMNRYSSIFSRQ
jgi:hypothetical protein